MSSDPSSLPHSALAFTDHHKPPPPPPPPPPPLPLASGEIREYRKGNWTVQETLVLITAKRLDDDRRIRGAGDPSSSATAGTRSAEQRWKWVENYCWKQGCLRSQNQCNDKWDNLLRDYKKVRDFESRRSAAASGDGDGFRVPSYWSLERLERRERNLPTNLAFEVYDALTDVLSRRASRRGGATHSLLPQPTPPPLPLHPPPTLPQAAPPQASVSVETTPEGSSETEGVGGGGGVRFPSPVERKRRRGLGSSVLRGAAELARTLMACEEKRERRHRDLMQLEERRLRMEEDRTEMNRQAVAGLIASVNALSAEIHALVADHRRPDGP
ncbi:hypothetical protein HPP92_025846 [Vanilla planifolia]|uniref:Myb-like domain-containing protein n=1 Tax=Vanilla planifolia TaxID=51239 RepID=A0A835PKC8_VANPL|nr:hypothetical protein HPP92_025846 [Vanilla planifolia]